MCVYVYVLLENSSQVGWEKSFHCVSISWAPRKAAINPAGKLATSLPDILRNLHPPHTHKYPAHACILQGPVCERDFSGKPDWDHRQTNDSISPYSKLGPLLNQAFNPKFKVTVFRLQSWESNGGQSTSSSKGRGEKEWCPHLEPLQMGSKRSKGSLGTSQKLV